MGARNSRNNYRAFRHQEYYKWREAEWSLDKYSVMGHDTSTKSESRVFSDAEESLSVNLA